MPSRPLCFPFRSGVPLPQPPAAETARPRGAGIAIHVATTAEQFAELAPAWNRVHDEAAVASIFTSWIWQFHWWQVYGGTQPLRLLVASEGEEAIGILPLYVHTVSVLGVPVRLLRLVGTGGDTHPDDLGPILAPRCAQAAADKLAHAALALPDADVLVLTDLSPDNALAAAVERAALHAGRALVKGVAERIAFIRLPGSWDAYLQSLSKHRRTRLRYARRRLAAAHARFFVWEEPASLDTAFDRLAELHQRRWTGRGGSKSFASAEYLEFHRRVVKGCLRRGWLRLYCLELDQEIVAIIYAYRFHDAIYWMQSGFDPDKSKLEVGNVLLGYALEHAIGEGNRVFDFLRGDHAYKDKLATGYRITLGMSVFRANAGALAYRLSRTWLPRFKARLLSRPAPRFNP